MTKQVYFALEMGKTRTRAVGSELRAFQSSVRAQVPALTENNGIEPWVPVPGK